MIASFTSPAGAPAICSNTMCPIRSIPSSPARCASAASLRAQAIPARRTANSAAVRKWSRSAATVGGSISPTRSMAPSIPNSIPRGSTAGWSSSTPNQVAASLSIRNSSSIGRRDNAHIRSACRAATAPRIPTAIRDGLRRVSLPALPDTVWLWLAIAGLGLFHGINPAMGWLFAVLFAWAGWHVLYGRRHEVRFGMQVGLGGLFVWSFLMANAHGAGLMLIPAVIPLCLAASPTHALTVGSSLSVGLAALSLHTAAMLATIGIVSIVVYKWIGVGFLRRGWINLDLIWTIALVMCGIMVLVL